MTIALWDYDAQKYTLGAISEDRCVEATHNKSGKKKRFKNATEFYGHYKTKSGGWLAEANKDRKVPWTADDFTVEVIQEPKPVQIAYRAVDNFIQKHNNILGATGHYGYIGKGDSWRVEASTILKYKGQRADFLKPIHLDAIVEYILERHAGHVVTGLEADDQCVMDCVEDPQIILVHSDKDYKQMTGRIYNPDTMTKPEKIGGFGYLSLNSKKNVDGRGRMFLYHQILSGDSSDNYKANSASDKKWGEKSSYELLNKCSNDKQAWEAIVKGYKLLYPEPKEIVGWRGEKLTVSGLDVLQENFTMAFMLRTMDEYENRIQVTDIMDKLKVSYGEIKG